MYASFFKRVYPELVEGRAPRKWDFARLNLHVELFAVPSKLATFYEIIDVFSRPAKDHP
jgi:hypothetical protein